MCYADQQLSLENDCLMKIDSERYVNVTSIRLYFGEIMCSVLLAYHCITGCDKTSHPANICKVRHFQKLIEKQAFHLLKNLGNHMNSYKDVGHAETFYHTIMYSGLTGESITKTRVCMYQKQRIKTSPTLISDEERTVRHLNRSDLQCLTWKECMKQNMIMPKLERHGWYMKDGKIRIKTKKLVNSSKYANKSDLADDADADDKDDDYIFRKKKHKVCFIS